MFISDEEANRRLKSSKNVLTVIDKEGDRTTGVAHTQEPDVITPDDVEVEDATCASSVDVMAPPDGSLLRKMLGMKNGRKAGVPNMPLEMQAATAVSAQLTTLKTAAAVFDTSIH